MKISVLHISDKKPSRALRKVGKKKTKKSKKIFEYPNKVTPQTPEKKKQVQLFSNGEGFSIEMTFSGTGAAGRHAMGNSPFEN